MPTDNTCQTCGGTGVQIDRLELKVRRIKKNLGGSEVARAMGISPGYFSDLEKGRKSWNADLLAKFNKAIK